MFVLKCDLCKKDISHYSLVSVTFCNYEKVELCEECSSPIFKFLKNKKFIDKDCKKIKTN